MALSLVGSEAQITTYWVLGVLLVFFSFLRNTQKMGIFSAAEVSRLAGFKKPWMLGHLEREAIFVREHVEDRRHGRPKKYTYSDLVVLRAINRLLQIGARPARIKQVISKLRDIFEESGADLSRETFANMVGVTLFVSNDTAYVVTDDGSVRDLIRSGQLAFGFMVDLKPAMAGVDKVIHEYLPRRCKNLKADMPTLDKLCLAAGI